MSSRNQVLDEILSALEGGRDSEWVRNALRILSIVGPKLGQFTTCDLWKHMDELMLVKPDEPRSMAVVITKARAHGWIVSTNNWKSSDRKVNHGRPVRVWRWLK